MQLPGNLFVRVFGIYLRLRLLRPHALVKALQQGALKQRQSPLHFTAAQPQGLLTLGLILETQRVELPHLNTDTQQGRRKKDEFSLTFLTDGARAEQPHEASVFYSTTELLCNILNFKPQLDRI